MSFEEKKIICSPDLVLLFLVLVPDLYNFSILLAM